MESMEQIWQSSRNNAWSFAYPACLALSVGLLVAVSFVRSSAVRLTLAVLVILGGTILACDMSALEIGEKWRIRQSWAMAHADQLTQLEQQSVYADGANLTFGPIAAAVQAFFILVGVAFICTMIKSIYLRLCEQQPDVSAPTIADEG